MKIDNSQTKVTFSFTPAEYILVHDERYQNMFGWSLNHLIDRSEKDKGPDIGIAKIYLTDEEAEACKKAGFSWMGSATWK